MIEIRELNYNAPPTILRGRSLKTIATRRYGRQARVHYNGESVKNRHVHGFVQVDVLVPTRTNAHMIMATWLVDADVYDATGTPL